MGRKRAPTGLADRRGKRDLGPPLAVDEVHHHEAVVDDDPGEGHHAEQRQDGQIQPHEDVSPDRPDEAERNRRHDDEGLDVGLQRNREEREDHKQRDEEAALEAFDGVPLLGRLPLEREVDAGVVREDLGKDTVLKVRDHVAGRDDVRVDVGGHAHRALAVHAADGRVAPPFLEHRDLGERHLAPGRGSDAHALEVSERGALVVGIADHDPDVVTAALDAPGPPRRRTPVSPAGPDRSG